MVRYPSNNDHMLSDTKLNPIELLRLGSKCCYNRETGTARVRTSQR